MNQTLKWNCNEREGDYFSEGEKGGRDRAYIDRRQRASIPRAISCNQSGTSIIIIIIIIYISSRGVFDLCLYCALP